MKSCSFLRLAIFDRVAFIDAKPKLPLPPLPPISLSSVSQYWAGSFDAPTTADEPYTWESENDKDQTDMAILASGDDTKTFTYQDGVISYEVSAMGVTQTVKLEKQ